MLADVINSLDQTRFDRAHFSKFGDFSLNFEVVYYVLSPDYNLYMDIQQEVNLLLLEKFTAAGIEFAFPTQTLYVAGASDQRTVRTERIVDGNGRAQNGQKA